MTSPNLLSVNVTDARIAYKTPDAMLTNSGEPHASHDLEYDMGGIEVSINHGELRVDSYAARSSMGYGQYNMLDFMKTEASKGESACSKLTQKIVSDGDAMARGSSPTEIVKNHVLSEARQNRETITKFFPGENADVSISKTETEIERDPAKANIEWRDCDIKHMLYTPYRFEFDSLQRCEVDIIYNGKPDYFPDSAAPNHPYTPLLNTKG